MTHPASFHWVYHLHGGAFGSGEGISRTFQQALDAATQHIRKTFPRSPTPQLQPYVQEADAMHYNIVGGDEYAGGLSVAAISQQDLMQLSLSLQPHQRVPVAEANPRARNNWAFLLVLAEQLAVAIVASLGASTWGALTAMSIPERASWLEKNANRLSAVSTLGLSMGLGALLDRIPRVPVARKQAWLEVAALLGRPDIQAIAVEAGQASKGSMSAVVAGRATGKATGRAIALERRTISAKRNPGLSFKQAWRQARATGQALKTPLGFIVRPINDEEYGPWFADYVTDRLVSGTTEGVWEVVPPPESRNNPTRRNPALTFDQAWRKAYASGQSLKAPDGRVLKPVKIDGIDGEVPDVAYYETGRLASMRSFDGVWGVVPEQVVPPRCSCGSTEEPLHGDEVHPGYKGWPICPHCRGV